ILVSAGELFGCCSGFSSAAVLLLVWLGVVLLRVSVAAGVLRVCPSS
ncbi:hypothetical protein A2U01_0057165, partial [Trifolium medium]|nr:hypothetical protein [Trifolium medium]